MRENMAKRLSELPFLTVIESGANYITGMCNKTDAIVDDLRLRGLQVKQLSTLRDWPVGWPDGFRVSVCPSPLVDRLIAGLIEFNGH